MNHPELQAAHMSLYPTKDSLVEAIQYIEAQGTLEPHQIFPLLMMYHNTLIKVLGEAPQTPTQHSKRPLHLVQ